MRVDRKALAVLNGMSKGTSTTEAGPSWKAKKPTPIVLPQNPTRSVNPFGKRMNPPPTRSVDLSERLMTTSKQVFTKKLQYKRGGAHINDERQRKKQKVDHNADMSESSDVIVVGQIPEDGRGDDSMNPSVANASSADEMDLLNNTDTSPERYQPADNYVVGSLYSDPIDLADDDQPSGSNVKTKVAGYEKISKSSGKAAKVDDSKPNWVDLITMHKNKNQPAKLRMKQKGGGTIDHKPSSNKSAPPTKEPVVQNSIIYEQCLSTRPLDAVKPSGRLTWKDKLSIEESKCSLDPAGFRRIKYCPRVNDLGFAHVHITAKQSRSAAEDEYIFTFQLDQQPQDQQFADLIGWLAKFAELQKISPGDAQANWNKVKDEMNSRSTVRAAKVEQLNNARNKRGPPPLSKQPRKPPLKYTPEPDPPESAQASTSTNGVGASSSAPVRRSTRKSTASEVVQDFPGLRPVSEPDKVILSYPQGVPGAVNITNADLGRLRPGEYLNDTLIEFGLKLWLKDIEEKNPELANQIHIFSSFFYKKLNQHKKGQQGYDNVKKWTSKFDIFQKKYIIVPINENLHWYLAIIYQPEHVLREAPVPVSTPNTRRQAKSTTTAHQEKEKSVSREPDINMSGTQDDTSEGEVERNLKRFQDSCIIDEEEHRPLEVDTMSEGDKSDLSYVSDPKSKEQDAGEPSDIPPLGEEPVTPASPMPVDDPPDTILNSVPAQDFYRRRRMPKKPDVVGVEDEEVEVVEAVPSTYIFLFDSLGTRHPAAAKNLSNYLKMEAMDKKGIANTSNCEIKMVSVPIQPNYCDCGLYLLHFAKLFMSDTPEYCKHILAPRPKVGSEAFNKLRQERWRDAEVADMRGYLAGRIRALSVDWLKDRQASKTPAPEQDVTQVDDSDSDVDIVETTIVTKGKRTGN